MSCLGWKTYCGCDAAFTSLFFGMLGGVGWAFVEALRVGFWDGGEGGSGIWGGG